MMAFCKDFQGLMMRFHLATQLIPMDEPARLGGLRHTFAENVNEALIGKALFGRE